MSAAAVLGRFAVDARPPQGARDRAAAAMLDTIGVILAGVTEPAATHVREVVGEASGSCRILGTSLRGNPGAAALANGTAAHALDFDDMCFVSLAHPSCTLVPAVLAAAEVAGSSGAATLEAYVVGFEVEARLGRLMNPRHYQRGWHCTSTLGAVGAAVAVCRLLGCSAEAAGHAIGIAASTASGVKENFGSMVKPLHAGLAARNGVLAALLAHRGLTSSALAIEGAQGYLAAFDSERRDAGAELVDLGRRWEIEDTGITVKLYPSCAGTHPTLDAVLDLRRREGFTAADVERIDVDVDRITPTILIHDRPASGLEAKFSMPYCVAAAVVHGRVGIDTFDDHHLRDPVVTALMPRVAMHVDPAFDDGAPALTRARVHVRLRGGRTLTCDANGARGYPERPASDAELDDKFLACARRVLPPSSATRVLQMLRGFAELDRVAALLQELEP